MKTFNLSVMADLMPRQEMARLRIVELENKSRSLMRQIMAVPKLPEEPRLAKMAELFPQHGPELLKTRRRTARSGGANCPAFATFGPAGVGGSRAFEHRRPPSGRCGAAGGVYTRQGIPRVGSRIGVMDAIG